MDHAVVGLDIRRRYPCATDVDRAAAPADHQFLAVQRRNLGRPRWHVGCGDGALCGVLHSRLGAAVTGIDTSDKGLALARRMFEHRGWCGEFRQVSGDGTGFPDASFDTVILHQVLHFAADPAPALAEAARVLRSGGRIAIVDFASHDHEELRIRHQHARLGFTDRQMAQLLKDAGFIAAAPLALEGGELVVKIWTAMRLPVPATPASAPAKEPA